MAADINRVSVSGNLTRDPELRRTQSGMDVLNFGIASNENVKNSQTGEWESRPNFIDCTMFGNRATGVSPYLEKGMKVFVDGSLRYSTWERDGQKRSKLEVIVDSIVFGGSRQGGQQGSYQAPQQSQYAKQPQARQQAAQGYQQGYQQHQQYAQPQQMAIDPSSAVYDDDIPF